MAKILKTLGTAGITAISYIVSGNLLDFCKEEGEDLCKMQR